MKFVRIIALCCMVGCFTIFQSQAQKNSKSLFNDIINKVTQSHTGLKDITGRWVFQGSACSFESDNILKQAGGTIAADQVEKQFDEYLAKVGINKGAGEFTFKEDKTYSAILGGTKLSGDYELSESSRIVTLTYLKGVAKINASVERSGNNLKLLFDADSLLKFLKVVSSATNNSTLKAITAVTDAYDGVQLGFNLQKQ